MKNLFADAASGQPVSAQTVEEQLSSAQQQMTGLRLVTADPP